MFNVQEIRKDFPILQRKTHDSIPLVYLDSTATSQKPLSVIEAMDDYYRRSNANIHRGVHTLAEEATAMYEDARERIAKFINAPSARQVIYTRNTTESINLVAYAWARANLKAGDVVVLTEMEHHSNLVPWYMLKDERGIQVEFISVTDDGLLDLDSYKSLLSRTPKLVAFTHMSNVLGTINPAAEIIRMAHEIGAITLVDAAQSVPHLSVDVQALDADFIAFSAHKMCGPTGIGALYGRLELLESMPPFLGGGDMIENVTFEKTTYAALPAKFEAGTPDIGAVAGLAAALDYMRGVDFDALTAHEQSLMQEASRRIVEVPGVRLIGTAKDKAAVVSFVMEGVHAHDVASVLDFNGVAVRAGHHCTQPLMRRLGIAATSRASFAMYNTHEEIDALVAGLQEVRKVFG